MEAKLKWGSGASTSNTLQKYSPHKEDLFFFMSQIKYDNGLRATNWTLLTYSISGGWRNWKGGDVTKQESGWKYEQMEPKLNALKLW
jgi:hypothetical protein